VSFSLEDHRQASMTLGKDYVFGDYANSDSCFGIETPENAAAPTHGPFVQIVNPEGIWVPRRPYVLFA
jgi:hypothetical protein